MLKVANRQRASEARPSQKKSQEATSSLMRLPMIHQKSSRRSSEAPRTTPSASFLPRKSSSGHFALRHLKTASAPVATFKMTSSSMSKLPPLHRAAPRFTKKDIVAESTILSKRRKSAAQNFASSMKQARKSFSNSVQRAQKRWKRSKKTSPSAPAPRPKLLFETIKEEIEQDAQPVTAQDTDPTRVNRLILSDNVTVILSPSQLWDSNASFSSTSSSSFSSLNSARSSSECPTFRRIRAGDHESTYVMESDELDSEIYGRYPMVDYNSHDDDESTDSLLDVLAVF